LRLTSSPLRKTSARPLFADRCILGGRATKVRVTGSREIIERNSIANTENNRLIYVWSIEIVNCFTRSCPSNSPDSREIAAPSRCYGAILLLNKLLISGRGEH
jgi:hypothetical protein